ncbi:MAG: heme o synthase [Candidatus Asgardarchaeia archaeon]
MKKIKAYLELFKIKQTFLLVFSGVLGYLIASKLYINLLVLVLYIIASILSICGTTGVNMYYDRDIDSMMFRTMRRPLPTKKILPEEAYSVSLIFVVFGVGISFLINFWVGLSTLIGFVVDIYVYTVTLKRRTPINIILGAVAGGMPLLGGYAAYTGYIDLIGILLSSIVMVWAMLHIWYIAVYYLEDYKKANIPMLPVVIGDRKTMMFSIIGLFVINGIVTWLWLLGFTKIYSLITSLLFTLAIASLSIKYLETGNKRYSRSVYKVLSPYLGVLLLVMLIERVYLPSLVSSSIFMKLLLSFFNGEIRDLLAY